MVIGSSQLQKKSVEMKTKNKFTRNILSNYLAFLLLLMINSSKVSASSADESVPYTVVSGDTIIQLVKRFLMPPYNVEELLKTNKIDNPDIIHEGSVLLFPRMALRHTPSYAEIIQVSCKSEIIVRNKVLAKGDMLVEGDHVDVPSDCSIRMVLEDGSIVALPSGGQLKIDKIRENVLESGPMLEMQISHGRVEANVNRGTNRTAPFQINTPTIAMGVRGTKFRVGHSEKNNNSSLEVMSGSVAIATLSNPAEGEKLVEGGRGVMVDAQGFTLADEALLPSPNLQVTRMNQRRWLLNIDQSSGTTKVWKRSSSLATFTDMPISKPVAKYEYWVDEPDENAIFYELLGESEAGLRGKVARYGICKSNNKTCNVIFHSIFPPTTPIHIRLDRVDSEDPFILEHTLDISTNNGLFVITGLPAGDYEWVIRQPNNILEESGAFKLLSYNGSPP